MKDPWIFMMGEKIRIREARAEDLGSILRLIRSVWSGEERFAERYYERYFTDDPLLDDDNVYVAEAGKRVVGVIGYCGDYFSNDDAYFLSWFVVEKKYRGWRKGFVSERLLKAVESDLKRYRVRRLFVSTGAFPERSHGFYIKHGFQFEARLRDYYGRGEDQIIMGKNL